MRKVALFLLTVGLCAGQISYVANKTTALSAAAEVITVQQIAAGTKTLQFVSASVDSTVVTAITIERDGTAATSTALTPAQVNPVIGVVATAKAWSASNAGAGT